MYIDYEYYQLNGGIVDISAFPILYKKAKYKLDYYTQNRINKLTEITVEIKDCMIEMINKISTMQGDEVTSFSNDGVSVSLVNQNEEEELYQIVIEMLPISLISTVIS